MRIGIEWSARIREALDRDRFALHAQRIIDVGTGYTLRHELFLRMVDEERMIPAGEFVMAAEEFGSIGEIDRWVVGRAIGIAASGRAVHLNLSMRSVDAPLLELIREQVAATGADPGNLVFELGEAQLHDASEEGAEFVRAVDDLGYGLAVDNFTSGPEGSALLRRFPLTYVKVGPELIAGLAGAGTSREAVSGIVLAAHRNRQRVIAQGVESVGVLGTLEVLGVDEAQGHVFGAAEPVEQALGLAV